MSPCWYYHNRIRVYRTVMTDKTGMTDAGQWLFTNHKPISVHKRDTSRKASSRECVCRIPKQQKKPVNPCEVRARHFLPMYNFWLG
jgi:hypothetical protein